MMSFADIKLITHQRNEHSNWKVPVQHQEARVLESGWSLSLSCECSGRVRCADHPNPSAQQFLFRPNTSEAHDLVVLAG